MPTRPRLRDPRSIVTPDAFEVAPELLGLPLSPPGRRLAAILIDLGVIGLIMLATRSVPLLLGVAAAVVFIRAGLKRTKVKGSVFNRAMRLSVGCLGLLIAAITIAVASTVGITRHHRARPPRVVAPTGDNGAVVTMGLGQALAGLDAVHQLRDARTDSAAAAAMRSMVRKGKELGMTPSDVRQLVMQWVPAGASWAADSASIFDRVLTGSSANSTRPSAAGAGAAPTGEALAAHFRDSVVADSLRHLQDRVSDLEAENTSVRHALDTARAQLTSARNGGFFSWVEKLVNAIGFGFGKVIDALGFGFGWAAIYMTVFTAWWKGQTIGKRLMHIRVLKLDGEPMTWWEAFDRQGGYAAGFATGLLGFAQVFWDANRQAIQDHISGTVVVLDGAEKVADWKEVL